MDRTRPDVDAGTMETLGMEGFEALKSLLTAFYAPPMDLGVTNRNGWRFDSHALRAVENLRPFNDPLLCAPIHEMDVADIDDVPFRNRFDHRQSHQDIHDFVARATAAGVLPLGVGQNHTILHPILHAIGKARPVDPKSYLSDI
ncbi:arginase family protein [Paraburkholderia phymatum]|uniref:arginase family protein n=1 Tax=Paraburkholderia phymatum TaxID=148447 RepID=UPI00319DEB1B